jgi:hypothetical protein
MTVLDVNSICAQSEDVVARTIEGDLVIVPLVAGVGDADGELFTLNETGKAMWDGLDGRKTLGEVAASLAGEYDAPLEQIEADVLGLMAELLKRKIVVVVT